MKETRLEHTLFGVRLVAELEAFLWDTNPWWQGKPMRVLPPFRRWLFDHALQNLKIGPRKSKPWWTIMPFGCC